MSLETGQYIMAFGLLIVVAGMIIYFFHDKLHWVGRLPGDPDRKREFPFLFSYYYDDYFQPCHYVGHKCHPKVLATD